MAKQAGDGNKLMASSINIVDYIAAQIASAGDVRYRKMFGEYAIYCDNKVIALVCDNKLYLKVTEIGIEMLPNALLESAYPGAKPSILVPEELFDNREFMTTVAAATAHALPAPKLK